MIGIHNGNVDFQVQTDRRAALRLQHFEAGAAGCHDQGGLVVIGDLRELLRGGNRRQRHQRGLRRLTQRERLVRNGQRIRILPAIQRTHIPIEQQLGAIGLAQFPRQRALGHHLLHRPRAVDNASVNGRFRFGDVCLERGR